MANPVTHVIVPILIVETYRRYFAKKKFSRWYVFLAGFFGGAPDFDIIFEWLVFDGIDVGVHRALTHSLLMPIALTIVGLGLFFLFQKRMLKHKNWRHAYIILFMVAIGMTFHTLLDGIDGFTQWFYPLSWQFYLPALVKNKIRAAIIDGVLLFVWLLYDEELFNDMLSVLRKLKRKIT